jgi:hypothetical protein
MNPTVAMFLRYLVTAIVMLGTGAGWWSEAFGNQLGDALVNIIAAIIAALPPAYAWLKIDNTPKTT